MEFQVTMNKELFKKLNQERFDLLWSYFTFKMHRSVFIGIVVMFVSVVMIEPISVFNFGFIRLLIIMVGSYKFIKGIRYKMFYNKRLDYFKIKTKQRLVLLDKKEFKSTWKFEDEYFLYKDDDFNTKINWKHFEGFQLRNEHIFLVLSARNHNSYILSKEEIGNKNFNELIDFLRGKLKFIDSKYIFI